MKTKIALKEVCSQLKELLNLPDDKNVAGLIEDNGDLVGWCVVHINDNGTIKPESKHYKTIKELYANFNKFGSK